MKLNIRSHRTELTEELRELVERRVYFALSRFSPRIARVSVTIEDINGSRAGVDQRCRIVIKLEHADEMTVEATDADVKAAISLAADRASRVVQRELERRRTSRRRPPSSRESTVSHDDGIQPADGNLSGNTL